MNKIAVIFFLILLALPVHAARVDNIDGSLRHMQVLIPPQGGPLSLDLALSYDTRLAFEDGPLGLKWTHSYDIILHRNSDGTRIFIGGLGQPHFFFSSTSGLKTSQGDHSTIKHNEDDTWTVGLNNGKKYYFTSEGVLTKIGDHLGNWVTIDRTKPDVVTITDPAKRKAVLHYTGKRIDWIQGPDNKV
ncbi:MAG: hypothetical protein GWN00_05575, partial [Aliifodinibius sp.]|nr:hypothetical protein [Fodinibius sp.]NIW97085.1 hypothetical protein [Phycisphaerae bacterium]NIY24294.1 hypothetical protein [Fodinibius sp.]